MPITILSRAENNFPQNLNRLLKRDSIPRQPFRLQNPVVNRTEQPIPDTLYLLGQFPQLITSFLSIIGSRKMPRGSEEAISDFLPDLSNQFHQRYAHALLAVVSGLTNGGDATAHQVTLEQMEQKNHLHAIGISATSINHPHPEADVELWGKMIQGRQTGVISEYPESEQPIKPNYYDRNRLTAWISGALIVYGVSSPKSGAMHTMSLARFANIPVFYLPSTVTVNVEKELLRRGCLPIETAEEFLEKVKTLSG